MLIMMMENKKKFTELEFRDSSICLLCIQTQKHTTDRNQQIGIGVHICYCSLCNVYAPTSKGHCRKFVINENSIRFSDWPNEICAKN